MALLIKKFGGTSVGDLQKIKNIAKHISISREAGNEIVIVVSAMGNTTDKLTQMAQSISNNPDKRELDMLLSTGEQVTIALLSIALNEYGIPAVSMTGSQVEIITESLHGKARILEIKTERIKDYLHQGYVVVIAGFQGASLSHNGSLEITTLGRGGSDTSAVALSTALGAEKCEIYTDVPGVLTTDPRIVEDAKLLEEAGVFSIVLECIETSLAKLVTKNIKVPTIGIGASKYCDGQILVFDDLIGLNPMNYKFVKKYTNIRNQITNAVSNYSKEVRKIKFPNRKYSYWLKVFFKFFVDF